MTDPCKNPRRKHGVIELLKYSQVEGNNGVKKKNNKPGQMRVSSKILEILKFLFIFVQGEMYETYLIKIDY